MELVKKSKRLSGWAVRKPWKSWAPRQLVSTCGRGVNLLMPWKRKGMRRGFMPWIISGAGLEDGGRGSSLFESKYGVSYFAWWKAGLSVETKLIKKTGRLEKCIQAQWKMGNGLDVFGHWLKDLFLSELHGLVFPLPDVPELLTSMYGRSLGLAIQATVGKAAYP